MIVLGQQQAGTPFALYLLLGFMGVIALIPFVLWIWTLVDCLTNEPDGSSEKLTWGVIIFVFGIFGAMAYSFGRRKERIRLYGK